TRDELLEVLRLYCVLPFGKLHSRNPQIIDLANKIGRTADAVAFKMVNFASLDPTIDRKGMKNVSALDRQTWSEFFNNLDRFVLPDQPEPAGGFNEAAQAEYAFEDREGLDVIGTATRRVNQGFFRLMIIASYESRCAITGISDDRLLVASHIDTWASNPQQRLNPRNGLCLNYLHDRAFETGLIAVAPDLSILYSSKLHEADRNKLRSVAQERLMLPHRFKPDAELLEKHRATRFLA
ncbi:MAG: HNH endonuclease, partial [Methylobacteriaceae bacterium]|nr:HNH endonuclease [Methylobacteriaceae bacterium]